MEIEPFTIAVPDEVLADLRRRIEDTRWPAGIAERGWDEGTDPAYLRDLLEAWAHSFDWRAVERELNTFAHFRGWIDGVGVHFVHARGNGPDPLPIVLTHGWPSTFTEHLRLLPLLAAPAAHGGAAEDAFDVVVPSLPGYGFSGRPAAQGLTSNDIADLWATLMRDGLGYQRFGAHGSDIGAGVTTRLGWRHPAHVAGVHLSALAFPLPAPPLSGPEQAYLDAMAAWRDAEGGYSHVHATKPATLGVGLNDSPAGLAAWIVEKFRAWSDSGGDIESRFTREHLLTNLTIYWATQTIGSSIRLYLENTRYGALPPGARIEPPAGFAIFANEFLPPGRPPREIAERTYHVARWTELPRGGHFPALEEPETLAEEIRAFFRPLRGRW